MKRTTIALWLILGLALITASVTRFGPFSLAGEYVDGNMYQLVKEAVGIGDVAVVGQTINADATATDIWAGSVDTAIYVAPTQARVMNITSASASDVRAVATFTMADAGTQDEVLLIGAKTYTLRDASPVVNGHVLREVTASATIDNIIAAINLGAGAGTKYATATTANAATTTAFVGAGDTMLLYAQSAIVTTSTVNSGFGAATAVLGTGANTVIVRGLTDWDTTQTSETLDMFGLDISPTTNSYVIVNSVDVVTNGGTTENVGIIKATAATDSSVSAYISVGAGKSHSGLLGIPSIETLNVNGFVFSILAAGTTDICNFSLLANTTPDSQLTEFHEEVVFGLLGTATLVIPLESPIVIPGPALVKMRVLSDTADSHVFGRFAGTLETN